MRYNHTLIIIIIIIISNVISSCKKQQTSELEIVNVLEPDKTELTISEIAEDISYIPLGNDTIISSLAKVVYSGGNYFVKDRKSKLLRFDKNWNLLNLIGRRGRGPQEYGYIRDFVVDPKTQNIYITGGKPQKLMVFSPDGKFLKTIEILKKHLNIKAEIANDKLFLFFYNGADHSNENMELIDLEGNLIKSFPNNYKFERGRTMTQIGSECLIYRFNGHIHFKEIFSDTLFYVDGQNLKPELILNSGGKRLTPEAMSKIINAEPAKKMDIMIKSLRQTYIIETIKYLFYYFSFDKQATLMIYNKSVKSLTKINIENGIKNDWDGGPNIKLKMNKDDNTLFSWLDAYELKQFVASDEFKSATPLYPEKKKELEQLAKSLDKNDNPVLMLVKLKE